LARFYASGVPVQGSENSRKNVSAEGVSGRAFAFSVPNDGSELDDEDAAALDLPGQRMY